MLDHQKVAEFIGNKRKEKNLTQSEVAEKLGVSFQAVSKWENGTLPNVEMLVELSKLLEVSVDEILEGREKENEKLSYSKAGVDISYTDAMKREMAVYLQSKDSRVMNEMGAFASLYDMDFPDVSNPVLVLKSEEPGSKQKLAMEYGYSESICHDMINHLVNDIAVMGARPLAVLDTIVCGSAEKETIKSFVKGISEACRNNECTLVGGETSIQSQVVEKGVYILTSSIAGIVDKNNVIDGSAICSGDIVLGVASNGLHTNGYSLVRLLMDKMPQMKLDKIENETFIEQIMKPHTPYYRAIKHIFSLSGVHGMAHITGGGIKGNLSRILHGSVDAEIDLSLIKSLPIFDYIQRMGRIEEEEMLATFNCGVGLVIVVSKDCKEDVVRIVQDYHDCYEIGEVIGGSGRIIYKNHIYC